MAATDPISVSGAINRFVQAMGQQNAQSRSTNRELINEIKRLTSIIATETKRGNTETATLIRRTLNSRTAAGESGRDPQSLESLVADIVKSQKDTANLISRRLREISIHFAPKTVQAQQDWQNEMLNQLTFIAKKVGDSSRTGPVDQPTSGKSENLAHRNWFNADSHDKTKNPTLGVLIEIARYMKIISQDFTPLQMQKRDMFGRRVLTDLRNLERAIETLEQEDEEGNRRFKDRHHHRGGGGYYEDDKEGKSATDAAMRDTENQTRKRRGWMRRILDKIKGHGGEAGAIGTGLTEGGEIGAAMEAEHAGVGLLSRIGIGGLLGKALVGGAGILGGGAMALSGFEHINSHMANEKFFGGKRGLEKSPFMQYLEMAGGGALAGAAVGGPLGAVVGATLSVGAGALKEYEPELKKLLKGKNLEKDTRKGVVELGKWTGHAILAGAHFVGKSLHELWKDVPTWSHAGHDLRTAGRIGREVLDIGKQIAIGLAQGVKILSKDLIKAMPTWGTIAKDAFTGSKAVLNYGVSLAEHLGEGLVILSKDIIKELPSWGTFVKDALGSMKTVDGLLGKGIAALGKSLHSRLLVDIGHFYTALSSAIYNTLEKALIDPIKRLKKLPGDVWGFLKSHIPFLGGSDAHHHHKATPKKQPKQDYGPHQSAHGKAAQSKSSTPNMGAGGASLGLMSYEIGGGSSVAYGAPYIYDNAYAPSSSQSTEAPASPPAIHKAAIHKAAFDLAQGDNTGNRHPQIARMDYRIGQQENFSPSVAYSIQGVESSFRPNAQASTSSAHGLFQFTKGTWDDAVKKYGKQLGVSRGEINNPVAQTKVAMALMREKANHLHRKFGHVSKSNIYESWFLGTGGADKFITALHKNPNADAARLFPHAARANHSVFYNADGEPKTVRQIDQSFQKRLSHFHYAYGMEAGPDKTMQHPSFKTARPHPSTQASHDDQKQRATVRDNIRMGQMTNAPHSGHSGTVSYPEIDQMPMFIGDNGLVIVNAGLTST